MKIKEWLLKIFRIETCIKCNKILSRKDKQNGGCGFANGKNFVYCLSCSQLIIQDLFRSKEPQFPKYLAKGVK